MNSLPKYLAEYPDDNMHVIIVNNLLNLNKTLVIPLALKGVTSYLPSRDPRASEYEDKSISRIDTTSKVSVWETYETSFV